MKLDDFIQEKAERIRGDKEHSASYLYNQVMEYIEVFVKTDEFYQNRTELFQGLSKFSNAICKAKPLMGGIYNLCHSVLEFIEELPKHERNLDEIRHMVLEYLLQKKSSNSQIKEKIRTLGSKLVINHNVIFSLSYSGYVRDTLKFARSLKKRFSTHILQSGPLNEGVKLALELSEAGIKTTVFADSNVVEAIRTATFVLLGCDRITETSFINKTGSHAAALIANKFDIPVYLLADLDKILLKRQYILRHEEEDPNEIMTSTSEKLHVVNQYFEEVPIEFVSKIITEAGIFETGEFIKRFLS